RYGCNKAGYKAATYPSCQNNGCLANGMRSYKYYEYEVIKPLPAIQGKIAPAFGEPGGGIQILPNMQDRVNVEWLLKNGYIREVR
ncbi:TNT domain-containing protein, partial [Escherichia coli]